MLRNFLKWILIIGIMLLMWVYFSNDSQCQDLSKQEKLLTEISIDIKYIKTNIEDMRQESKEIKQEVRDLDKRVGTIENKTNSFENTLCEITERNNFFMGIIGAMLIAVLGLQYKRTNTFRNGNGKSNH